MQNQTVLATTADIPAIMAITKSAFARYSADLGLPVAALSETAETVAQDLRKKDILLGLRSDDDGDTMPIGAVRLEYFGQKEKIAYLSRFGVHQDAPKCGMGDSLLEAAIARCREQGASAIVLHTATKMLPLISLYIKHGFYVHSTSTQKGYIRAMMVCELVTFDALGPDISAVSAF